MTPDWKYVLNQTSVEVLLTARQSHRNRLMRFLQMLCDLNLHGSSNFVVRFEITFLLRIIETLFSIRSHNLRIHQEFTNKTLTRSSEPKSHLPARFKLSNRFLSPSGCPLNSVPILSTVSKLMIGANITSDISVERE